MKSHLLAGALAALITTTAFGAQAAKLTDYVSLAYDGGVAPLVTLGITNGATTVNTAVVGPLANSMTLKMDGHVKCVKDKSVDFQSSKIFFGAGFAFRATWKLKSEIEELDRMTKRQDQIDCVVTEDYKLRPARLAGQENVGWI